MSEQLCVGCLQEKEEKQAESWCYTCTEFVCLPCSKVHKRLSHMVIPIQKATEIRSLKLKLDSKCDVHSNENLVFFCIHHDKVICTSCLNDAHQTCKPLSIDEAALGVKDGTAIADLETRLAVLQSTLGERLTKRIKMSVDLDVQVQILRNEISSTRKSINAYFDDIEFKINSELSEKRRDIKQTIEKEAEDLKQGLEEVNSWKIIIDSLKNYGSEVQLFQMIKILDSNAIKTEAAIKGIQIVEANTIEFQSIINENKLMTYFPVLGYLAIKVEKLEMNVSNDKARQGQVFVKRPRDNRHFILVNSFKSAALDKDTKIRSCCFLPGNRIMLSDTNSKCIYVCDTNGDRAVCIHLDIEPIDLAFLDEKQAIVTCYMEGFQTIDLQLMKPGKFVKTEIPVDHVACVEGKIWIVNGTNDLHKVDINGKSEIKLDTEFDSFHNESICSSSTDSVYRPDSKEKKIYKTSADGNEVLWYHSEDLVGISGMTSDDKGVVYVAGKESNNVHRISGEGQGEIILDGADGIVNPTSLAYNKDDNKIMVINDDGKRVNIYKL